MASRTHTAELLVLMTVWASVSGCAAPTPVPTATAAASPTATPVPPTSTAVLTATPSVPTIDVGGIEVPDPKVTNPELFDLTMPNAVIVEFSTAFGVLPSEVGGLRAELFTGADGNPFVVLMTSDIESTKDYDESGVPLVLGTRDDGGGYQWQAATLDNIAKRVGWIDFGALLNFSRDANPILVRNFGGGIAYMDWNYIEPQKGKWDFSDPGYNVLQAFRYGMSIRGNLIWGYGNVADWVRRDSDAHGVMLDYISHVMAEYKKEIRTWDVMNEVDRKRRDVFWNALGVQGVRDAYATARMMDPDATLLYNDFIDVDGTETEDRLAVLGEVVPEILKDGNLDAIGVQIIVSRMRSFDADKLRRTLEGLDTYNLPLYIPEFSVVIHGPNSRENLLRQAQVGGKVIQILREDPLVREVTAFGVDDATADKIYGQDTNGGFWMKGELGAYHPKPIVFAMLAAMLR